VPAEAAIVLGKKLPLPVKVARAVENSAVRFTLLTSQIAPLANNQPDLNKTLRLEKAVELGPKATDADAAMLVPPELPAPVYDICVHAELLTPDKKLVLASAYTPVRRMSVRNPLVVKLDGAARIETLLEASKETTIKVAGKIERLEGLRGDVAVAITGLPAGARADTPTVKGDATAFSVNVVLPANTAAGEIRGVRLSASAAPDPKQANVRVRSREVELTLVVKAAAAKKLLGGTP
jgi:hypothetical protein